MRGIAVGLQGWFSVVVVSVKTAAVRDRYWLALMTGTTAACIVYVALAAAMVQNIVHIRVHTG